jgi:thiol-disulfide isomerase/thioredoxin
MRRITTTLCATALLALGGGAATGCGGGDAQSAAPSQGATQAALEGSPPKLAAVHAQANKLLEGGPEAFEARLRELRGRPVVVNKWASWCGPCRLEFPIFQRVSVQRGKRIAFLGVNSNDSDRGARQLLDELPLSFPSYRDPDQKIAALFNGAVAFPTTAFYDSKGKLAYVRQGPYRDQADLAADIERYAR